MNDLHHLVIKHKLKKNNRMRVKGNSTIFFILLYMSIYLVITLIQQEYIVLPNLLQLDIIGEESKAQVIENFNRTRWIAFLVTPLIILVRLSLVSLCLYIGSFFFPKMVGIKFEDCWRVAVKVQMVLVIYSIIVCTASLLFSSSKVNELLSYSSLAFLGGEDIEQWIKIPLAACNIFEIAYLIVMSYHVMNLVEAKFGQSFKFVISTYGVGYFFYIAFIMFLLLYLT